MTGVGLPLWRRAILRALNVRVTYRPETMEALSSGRAIVICMEHRSLADGPIVALASPVPLHFAVTPKHAVHNPLTSRGIALMKRLGLGDRTAINGEHPFGLRALRRLLQDDRPIMVFPEGRIAKPEEELAARGGFRWLAESTTSPVVTIRLEGNERSRLFSPAGRSWWPRVNLTF
jgi:1-acyl-sn-glycerol-3-phosphate acyltransferase